VTTAASSGIRLPVDAALRHRIAVLSGMLAGTIFLSAILIETIDQNSARHPLDETAADTRPALLHPLVHAEQGGGRALLGTTRPEPSSEHVATLTKRARRLCDAGNFQGAAEFYRAILDLAPHNIEAQLALGSIALYQRRYTTAEFYLGNLIEQLPQDDPVVRMRLGSAQFRSGKIGIGLQNLKMALERTPEDGALCFELACVYATLRDRKRAYYYLECARERLGGLLLAFISDHHLDPIRQDARFGDLLKRARSQTAGLKNVDDARPEPPVQTGERKR
jgi:predicted Zn-dependent protease